MWAVLLFVAVVVLPEMVGPFDRAAKRTGHSQKELAYAMGTTPPRLSHQLRGHGSCLSVARLFLAPRDFFDAFLEELRVERGSTGHSIEDVYQLLSEIRPHMARASRSTAQKAEVA